MALDKGEGGGSSKLIFFVDVIYVWPLTSLDYSNDHSPTNDSELIDCHVYLGWL